MAITGRSPVCDHVVVAGDESKLALESASIGQADTLPPLRPSGSPDRVAHDEGGRYSIGAEVARGAMGSIRRAEDLRLGRTVALKELLGDAPDRAARFEREALVTARLQHPAIVPVYDAGKLHDGRPFYAMKLVGGRAPAPGTPARRAPRPLAAGRDRGRRHRLRAQRGRPAP